MDALSAASDVTSVSSPIASPDEAISIDAPNAVTTDAPRRALAGATWAGLAFVAGTLFALLPMYYFYAGTATPQQEAPKTAVAVATDETVSPPSHPLDRFAARLTYELSQAPEEPAADPTVAVSSVPPALAEPVALRRQLTETASERAAGSRIANARPISSTPPDPRDTTREMENESRQGDYRAAASRTMSRTQVEPVQPRVIEGRDIVVPQKVGLATRPIGVSSALRQPEDADTVSRIATAAPVVPQERNSDSSARLVAGVSPIGPAPETVERAESTRKDSASEAANGRGDVIESRLAATREWLTTAPQTMHTIQIMGTNSQEQLKSQLRALAKVLEPQKIYVFRTFAQGKPAMTVVYGGYADRHAALQALEKLPPSVSANRPVLRTVNGIRSEMKQHGIKIES